MNLTEKQLEQLIKLVLESDEDEHLKGLIAKRGLQLEDRVPILKKGDVVGFYTPQHQVGAAKLSRTGAIYITPDHRREGLAGKTLSDFSAKHPTFAFIDSTNEASRKMYEKVGFSQGKHTKGDWYDGHWYYNDSALEQIEKNKKNTWQNKHNMI